MIDSSDEGAPLALRRERLGQQHDDAGHRDDRGGDDRAEVEDGVHRASPGAAAAFSAGARGRGSRPRRLAHLAHQRVRGRLDAPREDRARDAHHEGEHHERQQHGQLARGKVGKALVLRVAELAVEDALHHPQHVGRRQDHAERGHDHEPGAEAPGADQDQELAHEAVGAGHRDRGQADQQEHREVPGHRRAQPAELGDLARVAPVVEHADQEEERARSRCRG